MRSLYIVATPIGNLQDVTLRAANTLLAANIIVAESTSKAGILLEFLKKQFPDIKSSEKQIISLTEDEEEQKIPYVLNVLEENDAALISEAGTPLISDPGFKLVREAVRKGVNIIPIPGPSAVIAALSASGLPTDRFLFLGFLPKSMSKKETVFGQIKNLEFKTTIIIYESPERLLDTLKILLQTLGDIDIVIARELTKIHEEIRRENVTELIAHFQHTQPRGEFVIII